MDDYITELGYISGLLETVDHDAVVILGDFNADLRSAKSRFSRELKSFLMRCNLLLVGQDSVHFNHMSSWLSSDFLQQSLIDYVVVSCSMKPNISSFEVLEGMSITSDHWPIITSMDLSVDFIQPKDSCNSSPVRMLWKDSTAMDIARYRDCVEKELSYIYIPVEAAVCNDPDNCEHKSELQSFYDALVRLMVKSGKGASQEEGASVESLLAGTLT